MSSGIAGGAFDTILDRGLSKGIDLRGKATDEGSMQLAAAPIP
jgi:hypothetical protein